MTTLPQISINFSAFNTPNSDCNKRKRFSTVKLSQPINCYSFSRTETSSFSQIEFRMEISGGRLSILGLSMGKDGILVEGLKEKKKKKKKRMTVVKFNQGFGFNGGGGGGRDNSNTARLLGNLAFAIGLTYLSMTGQLGWVLDAIVSVWLLAVILPIVGLGAFLWWAGRDMVQGSCPNCGNDFQTFKSTSQDLQLCPFCSQPFSVVDDEFVKDPVKFSNQSTTFGQAFNDFSPRSKKGKESSIAVVDVEAEIKDAD